MRGSSSRPSSWDKSSADISDRAEFGYTNILHLLYPIFLWADIFCITLRPYDYSPLVAAISTSLSGLSLFPRSSTNQARSPLVPTTRPFSLHSDQLPRPLLPTPHLSALPSLYPSPLTAARAVPNAVHEAAAKSRATSATPRTPTSPWRALLTLRSGD